MANGLLVGLGCFLGLLGGDTEHLADGERVVVTRLRQLAERHLGSIEHGVHALEKGKVGCDVCEVGGARVAEIGHNRSHFS